MVQVWKKNNSYLYIDSDTQEVVSSYGPVESNYNISQYSLQGESTVSDSPNPVEYTLNVKESLYLAAINAGHSIDAAQVISGYTG